MRTSIDCLHKCEKLQQTFSEMRSCVLNVRNIAKLYPDFYSHLCLTLKWLIVTSSFAVRLILWLAIFIRMSICDYNKHIIQYDSMNSGFFSRAVDIILAHSSDHHSDYLISLKYISFIIFLNINTKGSFFLLLLMMLLLNSISLFSSWNLIFRLSPQATKSTLRLSIDEIELIYILEIKLWPKRKLKKI